MIVYSCPHLCIEITHMYICGKNGHNTNAGMHDCMRRAFTQKHSPFITVFYLPRVRRPPRVIVYKRVVWVGDPKRGGRVVTLRRSTARNEYAHRSLHKGRGCMKPSCQYLGRYHTLGTPSPHTLSLLPTLTHTLKYTLTLTLSNTLPIPLQRPLTLPIPLPLPARMPSCV